MQDPVLSVQGLKVGFFDRQFGAVEAVKNVSFRLERGKSLAMVGESGSGKSVSALALMGLLPPNARIEAHTLRLSDLDLRNLSQAQLQTIRGRRMAMIFQEPMSSLNPLLCVGDQIVEVLRIHLGLGQRAAQEKTLHLIDQVGLPSPRLMFRRYPHELSGGQLQRIMIAMAISCEPELLIADEPTTALDVTIQRQVIDLILELQSRYKMSLLFITHDLALVADVADDVAVMYKGEMLENKPTRELFEHPSEPYTRGLLACRPPLHKRPRRLLTVADFMKGDGRPHVDEAPIRSQRRAGSDADPIILELEDVSKVYEQKLGIFSRPSLFKALDAVNLKVRRGMRLGIVGESGCGKTTLARSMIRLITPSSGRIIFEGQDISRLSAEKLRPVRKRLQYIFQNPYAALNPRLTVSEILTEALIIHAFAMSEKERLDKARHTMELVGLKADMIHRYPHEFSGGQRQRICIARVLMLDPELIICDEAVSALDVSVQAQIINLLLDVQERTGITFIFISHDLSVVKYFAEEVCVMSQGRIVERGEADAIYKDPQHPFTRRLLEAIPRGMPKGSEAALGSYY